MEEFISRPDHISNADISAICLEAGMQAVRKNRCAAASPASYRQTAPTACITRVCEESASVASMRASYPYPSLPTRYVILHKDFEKAYKSTIKKTNDEFAFYK